MTQKIILLLCAMLLPLTGLAAVQTTGKGKILFTQGHIHPTCRMVRYQANDSGTILNFRLPEDVSGNGMAQSVFSAMIANRDVNVYYDTETTSGCGLEPAILILTVY